MDQLQTDERLEAPSKPERDMDSQMLLGCSSFVAGSFITYFLCIWPFLVWLDIYSLSRLVSCMALGFVPAFLQGILLTVKFEIAGAAGFVGGILTASIFIYLRFEQAFLEAEAHRTPTPEYPHAAQWIAPTGIVLLSILIVCASLVYRNWRHKSSANP